MKAVKLVASWLLAIPLVVFGGNYFVQMFPLPEGDGLAGDQLLQDMRSGGLMAHIAFSHVVIGLMLLVRRLRFAAALLQLPIGLGIVAFHHSMLPAGLGVALFMLVLNLVVLWEPARLRALVAVAPNEGS